MPLVNFGLSFRRAIKQIRTNVGQYDCNRTLLSYPFLLLLLIVIIIIIKHPYKLVCETKLITMFMFDVRVDKIVCFLLNVIVFRHSTISGPIKHETDPLSRKDQCKVAKISSTLLRSDASLDAVSKVVSSHTHTRHVLAVQKCVAFRLLYTLNSSKSDSGCLAQNQVGNSFIRLECMCV